ncbi:GNAT family N-acetyltransferase [Paenibacillus soyae]|uniref:GNAT family N-acetyltransferase n=1 Tax=Paenibacillus soyae TaxID=2969249 RepID=A0A9X2S9F3_9BACL|nr:GNAT family N-acetyltransferase [Paenibacillus soyae]MCR2803483.1 GNAT family N-acetyltransferase [Paenibacillus soyae]
MSPHFPILRTDRLILRPFRKEDARDMLHYLSDPEVMKHYGMAPFSAEEEACEEVDWYDSLLEKGTGIRWALTLGEDAPVIGSCGYHQLDRRHNRAELGYELAREHWGRGLMSEALRAILAYGYGELGLNRIQALVEPANAASTAMLRKLGFREEGVLAEYEYTLGKYDDLSMFALLKRDFQ